MIWCYDELATYLDEVKILKQLLIKGLCEPLVDVEIEFVLFFLNNNKLCLKGYREKIL